VVELYQQWAILPVASKEYQAYSAVTVVTGYCMTLNDSPAYGCFGAKSNVAFISLAIHVI